MSIIGFTGTRKGTTSYQKSELVCWIRELFPSEVHHGMCEGADEDFHDLVVEWRNWAIKNIPDFPGCQIVGHPPINKKFYKHKECDVIWVAKDYHERNLDIAKLGEYVIGCPEQAEEILRSGTWSTIRRAKYLAKTMKKEVIVIPPYGGDTPEW